MIIEAIVSTVNEEGMANFAPMGVEFTGPDAITLRPFRTSQTYRNLLVVGEGVANLTDDALVFVQTALFSHTPAHVGGHWVRAPILRDALSYYEFVVTRLEDDREPARVEARVVSRGGETRFSGLCRARFAVIEATIDATRIHLLGMEVVRERLQGWRRIVERTGGPRERRALEMVEEYLRRYPGGGTSGRGCAR